MPPDPGPLRQGFMRNLRHHRRIVAAWATRDLPRESPAKSTE